MGDPGYWHWLPAEPRAGDPVIPIKGQLSMSPRRTAGRHHSGREPMR
jgi:hypothetical protein